MFELIITSSVLILAIVLLRRVLRGKISLRLQYALWALAAVRLLVPVTFGSSPVSVLNAVPAQPGPVYVQYTGDVGNAAPAEPAGPVQTAAPSSSVPPAASPSPRPPAEPGVQFSTQRPEEDALPANTTVFTLADGLLFPLWCAGAAIMAVWFLFINLTFRRQLRTAQPVEVPDCPLPVFAAESIPSPCLFGLFKPAIYLTPACLEDETRLRHVLAHELTHWRHKDPLWSLVRCLCLSIWWFNPLVWLAAALSRRDCELACDEGALVRLGEDQRTAYGRTLIGLMSVSASPAHLLQTATTMVDRKKGIKERLTLIAKKPRMAAVTAVAVAVVAVVTMACTFTGAADGSEPESQDMTAQEQIARAAAETPEELTQIVTFFTEENPDRSDAEYGDELLLTAYSTEILAAAGENAIESGTGYLLSLCRYDQEGYERANDFLDSNTHFFATDGTWYYGYHTPGDVRWIFNVDTSMEYEYSAAFSTAVSWVRSTVLGWEGVELMPVETALANIPGELEDDIVALTPEQPSQFLELEENEIFRAYCKPYYLLSSNLGAPFGWTVSVYCFGRNGFTIPNDIEPGTFWEVYTTLDGICYAIHAPESAPGMNRMEEIGQSSYSRVLYWIRNNVLSPVCDFLFMRPGGAVITSNAGQQQHVLDAVERMSEGNFVTLNLTETGYPVSVPFLHFEDDLPGDYYWMLVEDSGAMAHGDAVSPVDWVLTMTSQDGSASFQFYANSNTVACTVDGELNLYHVISQTNFDYDAFVSDFARKWYDSYSLAYRQSEITLDTSGWSELDWFGSDRPRYVVEDLLQRRLDIYTQLPLDNQDRLSFVELLSVEVFDMDDLHEPTRLCFNAEWVIAGPALSSGQMIYTGGSPTPITEGSHKGRWAVSSSGVAERTENGVWFLKSVGGSNSTADGDSVYLPDIMSCSDNALMYFLLNVADGASAEGAQYELGERFLKRPEDILNTMTWYNGVQPGNWPDSGRDGADFLIEMLVSEFTVMRDGPAREWFASALLTRFDDEDCGGMARNVREDLDAYLEAEGLNTPVGTVRRVYDWFTADTMAIVSFQAGEEPSIASSTGWVTPAGYESLPQITENWTWTAAADNAAAQNAFDRADWTLSFSSGLGHYRLEFYEGTDLVVCFCNNRRSVLRATPANTGAGTLTDTLYAWAQDMTERLGY